MTYSVCSFQRYHTNELHTKHNTLVHPLQGDISEAEVIEKIAEAIPQDDHLCFLIQNAAVGVPSRLSDLKRGDFEYAMAVNVTAPLFLAQRLLPKLKASKGRILHLGTGV